MKTIEPYLSEHPFLKDLKDEYLKLLVGCAKNVSYKPGEFIFRQGEEANEFYLIREGCVLVELFVPNRGAVTIKTLREGDVLGWSWLVPPYYWHFDARAADFTRAISLDGKCLRTKCENDHHFGYEMLKRFTRIGKASLEATTLQMMDVFKSPQ